MSSTLMATAKMRSWAINCLADTPTITSARWDELRSQPITPVLEAGGTPRRRRLAAEALVP